MPGQRISHRLRLLVVWCALGLCTLGLMLRSELTADNTVSTAIDAPISISADYATEGKSEDGQRVLILRGRCRIEQAQTVATARQIVIWQASAAGRESLAAYLEDDVKVEQVGQSDQQANAYLQLSAASGRVAGQFRFRSTNDRVEQDALFQRALARRRSVQRAALTQTQFVLPTPTESRPAGARLAPLSATAPERLRHIRVSPRSAMPINIQSEKSTSTVPPEQVTILTGGVNLVIEGLEQIDVIDLSADRVVIWTEVNEQNQFSFDLVQPREAPYQVYLEGNIVARQGNNVLRAERAYYDAREDRGLLLDAELSVKPPQLLGHRVRVRAEKIRQTSRNEFHASNAWTTTSQFGKPGYRIQSSDIFVEPYYSQPLELPQLGGSFDSGRVNPLTGAPRYQEVPWITSLNNTFILDDSPLFYLPYVSGPVEKPNIPLRQLSVNSDRVFGQQLRTSWDLLQLLGVDEPAGTSLNLDLNYFSQRGPSIGLGGNYQIQDLFGIPGPTIGEGIGNYIYDDGHDNLGLDRRDLNPPENNRGRLTFRHRHELPQGFTLQHEFGYLSDRNYLEQFYENEFDTGKDIESLTSLRQQIDNWQWSLLLRGHPFEFENNTQWLPRGDLTRLGQPLFGDWLSWSSHSYAGYANLYRADPPNVVGDLYSPLPYYSNLSGGVAMTRHELSAPLNLGPLNVVPYAWGEAAGWSEDFNGNSMSRVVGSVGVRGSMLFWKVMPCVQSRIFNLNGLAHKMVFDVDWSITDSSRSLSQIPQWNEFDDNAQERFRQRLLVNTFGGVLPGQLEPRFFAVRSGAGSSVTAPYHELVDDLHVLRFGWRHRLQTKVGPPERLRIKDWMTLDLEASLFPNASRDDFGKDFGLFGARYAWNVGDRTSLLANAAYDFFDGGMQLWDFGVLNQRSTRGSVYAGIRQVKAQGFESQILTANASYAMSDKWISTVGTAYDLAEGRNRGQSLTLTRVGADFLIHFGTNVDVSKDNFGVALSIEPRFGAFNSQSTQLSNLLGIHR